MNTIFAGDCEKHDLVLMTAMLLKTYREQPVSIHTDQPRHYRHLQGEVSGIAITEDYTCTPKGIHLYDWHGSLLPETEVSKTFLVTGCDRTSLDYGKSFTKNQKPDAMVFIRTECSITPKYLSASLPLMGTYTYWDSPRRRIDWIHDGRIDVRKLEPDFVQGIGELIADHYEITKPELKKLWAYVKKRR